jgi:uncharacterized protein (TIGR03083 family)
MTDAEVQSLVGASFTALADVLEAQPAEAWDSPSLCERWRVRDVVAHVSNAARYQPDGFMAEVQADGGDFGATIDRLAARDGDLDPKVLLGNLRDERLHRWVPPGGGPEGALTHVVIHGLDVTTPLGAGPWLADDARRRVLDVLAKGEVHASFGTRIDGVRLQATDLDWSHGTAGPTVKGTADDLILAVSGRDVDPVHLSRPLR